MEKIDAFDSKAFDNAVIGLEQATSLAVSRVYLEGWCYGAKLILSLRRGDIPIMKTNTGIKQLAKDILNSFEHGDILPEECGIEFIHAFAHVEQTGEIRELYCVAKLREYVCCVSNLKTLSACSIYTIKLFGIVCACMGVEHATPFVKPVFIYDEGGAHYDLVFEVGDLIRDTANTTYCVLAVGELVGTDETMVAFRRFSSNEVLFEHYDEMTKLLPKDLSVTQPYPYVKVKYV